MLESRIHREQVMQYGKITYEYLRGDLEDKKDGWEYADPKNERCLLCKWPIGQFINQTSQEFVLVCDSCKRVLGEQEVASEERKRSDLYESNTPEGKVRVAAEQERERLKEQEENEKKLRDDKEEKLRASKAYKLEWKQAQEKWRKEKEKTRKAEEEKRKAAKRRKTEALQAEKKREQDRKQKKRWAIVDEEEKEAERIRDFLEEDFFNAEEKWGEVETVANSKTVGTFDELDIEVAKKKVVKDPAHFERIRNEFVQDWVEEQMEMRPDEEQATAIAATDGDVKVTARAGSGKTFTLVARAVFLIKHCRVEPQELLLLAFNRKAAEEIKNRIEERFSDRDPLPHVMTFHALANALVRPKEKLIYDNEDEGNRSQSQRIKRVIEESIGEEDHQDLIRTLMLRHFREEWE